MNEVVTLPSEVRRKKIKYNFISSKLCNYTEYNYMVARGHHKLGRIRSKREILFLFLITFGFYWKRWCEEVVSEICYHIDDPGFEKYGKIFTNCMWPPFHILASYRISKLILNMEIRNNCPDTSPVLAFILGIFPIFSVLYLQRQLNNHWLYHISEDCC